MKSTHMHDATDAKDNQLPPEKNCINPTFKRRHFSPKSIKKKGT